MLKSSKICSSCLVEQEFNQFRTRGNHPKHRRGVCKTCISKRDSSRNKENREQRRIYHKNITDSLVTHINHYKSGKPCYLCNQLYGNDLMQFDHLDRSKKTANVRLIAHSHSLNKVNEEFSKCSIICIYCHRRKTKEEAPKECINDKMEEFGPNTLICKRCNISQNQRDFLICKGSKIRVCIQCERERTRNRRKIVSDYVNHLKETTPCADCGKYMEACLMDFDHLPIYVKKHNISTMCSRGDSINSVRIEIAKCEIVCAGCHLKRTKFRLVN